MWPFNYNKPKEPVRVYDGAWIVPSGYRLVTFRKPVAHAICILRDELEKAKATADERECKLPDGFIAEIETAIEILKKHEPPAEE